jgi:hypothetical protein
VNPTSPRRRPGTPKPCRSRCPHRPAEHSDPVGNVVHVHDDGISPSFFDNQQQQPDWDHTYDPLYRLVTATGRESAIDDQDPVPSWVTSGSGFGPTPPPSGTAARNYVQQIAYDPVGNLSSVQHFVPGQSSASWTRSYSYPADSNRLSGDTVGGVTAMRYQVGNPLARLVVSAIEKPRRCRPSAEFLGCCLVVGARRLKPRGNTWKAPLGAPAAAIRDAVAARRAL